MMKPKLLRIDGRWICLRGDALDQSRRRRRRRRKSKRRNIYTGDQTASESTPCMLERESTGVYRVIRMD